MYKDVEKDLRCVINLFRILRSKEQVVKSMQPQASLESI